MSHTRLHVGIALERIGGYPFAKRLLYDGCILLLSRVAGLLRGRRAADAAGDHNGRDGGHGNRELARFRFFHFR